MEKTLRELFGIQSDLKLQTGAVTSTQEGAVQAKAGYKFRPDLIRSMLTFWDLSQGQDPVYRAAMLSGPKGAGKTSIVEQWHAKLQLPLFVLNAHRETNPEDWLGGMTLDTSGHVVFSDGMVLRAARQGASVLINELNAADPDVCIALNDLAQPGAVITVPRTGEVVMPAPGFRIFATCNPAGGIYVARKELDPSTRRRFFQISTDYPDEEIEVAILEPILVNGGVDREVATRFAKKLVQVAKKVREQSADVNNRSDALPETVSTDELIKWATVWMKIYRTPNALLRSLDFVLLNGCTKEVGQAIRTHVTTIFGSTA